MHPIYFLCFLIQSMLMAEHKVTDCLGAEQGDSPELGLPHCHGPLLSPPCCKAWPPVLQVRLCPLKRFPSGRPWPWKPLDSQAATKPRPNRLWGKACLAFHGVNVSILEHELQDTYSNCILVIFIAYFQVLHSCSHLCFMDQSLWESEVFCHHTAF